MRILKPLTLAALPRAFDFRGERQLQVAMLGFFTLGAAPTGRLLPEQAGWEALLPALPAGEPIDELLPKPRAEVLVLGEACTPDATSQTEQRVRLRIGNIDKSVQVFGDRQWQRRDRGGWTASEPAPFTRMPLDWAHAWGGAGHADNPAGLGYLPQPEDASAPEPESGPLPNLELPGQPIRDLTQDYPAAGLAPIALASHQRQRLFGAHDAQWLRDEAPAMASTTDPEAFMRAPADQRLPGWLEGGEIYRIEGMHPQQRFIEGVLPRLRPRVFGRLADGDLQALPDAVLDTVWLLPNQQLGVLVWRTAMPCAKRYGEDVDSLLLAYEDATLAPRPVAHYQRQFALRIDPASAHLHVLNDAPLVPAISPEQQARQAARQAERAAALQWRLQVQLDELDAELWRRQGKTPPPDHQPPQAEPVALMPPDLDDIARGDADLGDFIERVEQLQREAEAEARGKLDHLEQELAERLRELPKVEPAKTDAAKVLKDAMAAFAPRVDPLAEVIAKALERPELEPATRAELLSLQQQRAGQAAPVLEALAPKPTVEAPPAEVGIWLRGQVSTLLGQGASLAERGLRGAALVGMDLRGQDLTRADLQHADLRGCDLRGARLDGALLQGARLEAARLAGASLCGANLSTADARRADLSQARLDQAMLLDTDLREARLDGSVGKGVQALRARLQLASLRGCHWQQAVLIDIDADDSDWREAELFECQFSQSRLPRADFSGARMEKTVMVEVQAPGSRWIGARLRRCVMTRADLCGAQLAHLDAQHCSWREGRLDDARGESAVMLRCDLGKASLQRAQLPQALLAHSLLMQADLRETRLDQANLLHALANDADLRGACLDGARVQRLYAQDAQWQDALLRNLHGQDIAVGLPS